MYGKYIQLKYSFCDTVIDSPRIFYRSLKISRCLISQFSCCRRCAADNWNWCEAIDKCSAQGSSTFSALKLNVHLLWFVADLLYDVLTTSRKQIKKNSRRKIDGLGLQAIRHSETCQEVVGSMSSRVPNTTSRPTSQNRYSGVHAKPSADFAPHTKTMLSASTSYASSLHSHVIYT